MVCVVYLVHYCYYSCSESILNIKRIDWFINIGHQEERIETIVCAQSKLVYIRCRHWCSANAIALKSALPSPKLCSCSTLKHNAMYEFLSTQHNGKLPVTTLQTCIASQHIRSHRIMAARYMRSHCITSHHITLQHATSDPITFYRNTSHSIICVKHSL